MIKSILYVEVPGKKSLPDASTLRIAATGAETVGVTDVQSAIQVINTIPSISLLISNTADLHLFTKFKNTHPNAKSLLVTDTTMDLYSKALDGKEDVLLDHVIANRSPELWTTNELRVTIQKILLEDIFGLEKYFAPGTPLQTFTVKGSKDREEYYALAMKFAEENRLGQYMAKLVFGITEEMLMNAIYDAPVAGGRSHYSDLPRTAPVELLADEYSTLNFGCDGNIFGISVTDPFGALTKEKLFQYLKKVLRRGDSNNLIDTKKGGAGLGLFKILYSSHSLIVNITPQVSTQFIALIDIHHQVRDFSKMTRSINFFE